MLIFKRGVFMAGKGRGGGKTPERVVELLTGKVLEFGQSVVARETGLTRLTIQRYLKGIGEPTQATLKKLADYFGVSVAWLRGEDYHDLDHSISNFVDTLCSDFESTRTPENLNESFEISLDILKSLENFRNTLVEKHNVSEEESKNMVSKYLGKILQTLENYWTQERLKNQ